MNCIPVSDDSIKQAAKILRDGGLVAFPTETVYGLGADAYNPHALAKIFEAKNRPFFDPLIIHIAAIETLEEAADLSLLNDGTRKKLFLLAKNLWPGPLSIILPKSVKIPGIATAGLQTAAIRFPDSECAQKLISLSGRAVAAPSANPFGSLSPTRAEHVLEKLGGKVDLILDGGSTRIGLESTVLDITSGNVRVLRPGGTPKEEIEKLIGPVWGPGTRDQGLRIKDCGSGTGDQGLGTGNHLVSPGLLKSHYAPEASLSVFSKEEIVHQPYKTGVAFLFYDDQTKEIWQNSQKPPDLAFVKVLSASGEALEAASHLFETLHSLDHGSISQIFAQLAPNLGLGEAINDRLLRASAVK